MLPPVRFLTFSIQCNRRLPLFRFPSIVPNLQFLSRLFRIKPVTLQSTVALLWHVSTTLCRLNPRPLIANICDEQFPHLNRCKFPSDVDECDQPGTCANGRCRNLPGAYSCTCNTGYEEKDGECKGNCLVFVQNRFYECFII